MNRNTQIFTEILSYEQREHGSGRETERETRIWIGDIKENTYTQSNINKRT